MWAPPRHGRRADRTNRMLLLMYLVNQISRLPFMPTITVAILAMLWLIHLSAEYPGNGRYCVTARDIGRFELPVALERSLQSTLSHADDMHIYYNSVSFLWKGVQLEQSYGSVGFAAAMAALAVLTMGLYPIACAVLDASIGGDYARQCVVGFSGVIFAAKTVVNVRSPGHTVIYGMSVPTKWASWVELVLIQLVTPNASFVGHLTGILAGLLFIAVEEAWTAMKLPVLPRVDLSGLGQLLYNGFQGVTGAHGLGKAPQGGRSTSYGSRQGQTYGSGTWGSSGQSGASTGRSSAGTSSAPVSRSGPQSGPERPGADGSARPQRPAPGPMPQYPPPGYS